MGQRTSISTQGLVWLHDKSRFEGRLKIPRGKCNCYNGHMLVCQMPQKLYHRCPRNRFERQCLCYGLLKKKNSMPLTENYSPMVLAFAWCRKSYKSLLEPNYFEHQSLRIVLLLLICLIWFLQFLHHRRRTTKSSGDHFTKKRASFQCELAFSFTTVCRKLASFSKKASQLFKVFHKATRFLWPRKHASHAVIGQNRFHKS